MSKTYQYRPQGVCSQLMEITVNEGILEDLQVLGATCRASPPWCVG